MTFSSPCDIMNLVHSNYPIYTFYPAGHHFSRNVEFPIEIISVIFIIAFFLYVKMDFQLCSPLSK